MMIFILRLSKKEEREEGRDKGSIKRRGKKIVFFWERALQRQMYPVEISLSVLDLMEKKTAGAAEVSHWEISDFPPCETLRE